MRSVTIKNIEIGKGIPKICLPIVASTKEGIYRAANELLSLPFDLVEWRCDWYEDVLNQGTGPVLKGLRDILGSRPILCTFRTKKEGGAMEISSSQYQDLVRQTIRDSAADLVDLELFTLSDSSPDAISSNGISTVSALTSLAREKGVKSVLSSHDFSRTPPKQELLRRIELMEESGADIAKIAVMPESPDDVLDLLWVTREYSAKQDSIPLITMSMGSLGCVSRICGQVFGSAVTFGSAGKASAPGQIPAEELSRLLRLLQTEGGEHA